MAKPSINTGQAQQAALILSAKARQILGEALATCRELQLPLDAAGCEFECGRVRGVIDALVAARRTLNVVRRKVRKEQEAAHGK